MEALQPSDEQADALGGLAFLVVFVLYGQLFGYGMAVASGVVEEKASRVVEIILSKLRPTELLAGKVLGIGLVGLVQLALIAVAAIVLVEVTGLAELPAGAARAFAAAFGWFVLGYTLYAAVFAAAGGARVAAGGAAERRRSDLAVRARRVLPVLRGALRPRLHARRGRLAPAGQRPARHGGADDGRRRGALGDRRVDPRHGRDRGRGDPARRAHLPAAGCWQTGNRIRLRQALAASRDVPARRA